MKIAFYTLGCKVNQYESVHLCTEFEKRGHEIVSHNEIADAYVINSCTVTAQSDSKSKKMVGHFRRQNEKAIIALIGCFPQAFRDKAYAVKDADIVLGNAQKSKVLDLVEEAFEDRQKVCAVKDFEKDATIEKMSITGFNERTRAFVKIQDGCNRFCSYCIIPTARGRICSKPIDEIISEITALSGNGYSEIVLVGIDLSSYGKEFNLSLVDAVEAVSKIDGVKRIRLGSLEPEIITKDELLRLSKVPEFCPQFHLSLQSGCDNTLKSMNRHYTCDEYKDIVKNIRSVFENATITTDVMVGFAGESEEDFLSSLNFVKDIGFLKVHVFPYSRRSGTRADKFTNHIDGETKKKRAKIMLCEVEKIRLQILEKEIGKIKEVLVESRQKNGFCFGYTKEYLPVYIESCSAKVGEMCSVEITSVNADGCVGRAIN